MTKGDDLVNVGLEARTGPAFANARDCLEAGKLLCSKRFRISRALLQRLRTSQKGILSAKELAPVRADLALGNMSAKFQGGEKMRRPSWAVGLACLAIWCTAATFRTPNFVVQAPTPEIAQRVGQLAEHYRREKALEWLGYELPPWNVPVPIRVVVLPGSPGGATSYQPIDGQIFDMHMTVQGPLERIYQSVLPHEITHTVLVSHFRCPLPRWADEGAAVLSEDEPEKRRHDQLVRQSLAQGRAFRLRVLFHLRDYPSNGMDIMTLYAQGYSVVRFLVETGGRATFLAFLTEGMRRGWDSAVQKVYQCRNIEELEERWLSWMRGQHATPVPQLAGPARVPDTSPTATSISNRLTVARPATGSSTTNSPTISPPAQVGPYPPSGVTLLPPTPCRNGECSCVGAPGANMQTAAPCQQIKPSVLGNVRLLPPVSVTPTSDGWVPVPALPPQNPGLPANGF